MNPTGDAAELHGGPAPDLPVPGLAHALVRAAALDGAGSIVCLDGAGRQRTLTYAQLLDDASRILAGAVARGVRRGDLVVLQVADQLDLLATFWACQLGGFVPVPVAAAPPQGSPLSAGELLAGVCGVVGPSWVVADVEPVASGPGRVLGTVAELRTAPPAPVDPPAPDPDDLAALLLTSGSTGLPKAVMLTHRNILSRVAATAAARGLTRANRTFNWMPLDHVGGLVMFHVRDVVLGCHQVHAITGWVLADPLRWLDVLSDHRCDTTWAPNFAFGLLVDHADRFAGRSWDLRRLGYVMNGGEAVRPRVARRFVEELAPFGLPATAMHPGWGMSETSSGVVDRVLALDRCSDDDRFVAVGRPHAGVVLRVVDVDGRTVAAGEVGRLQVSGPPITSGYFCNDRQNAQSFTTDGWFRTGDLAFVADGELTVTGRADDVVEIGGIAFHGHEIEAAVEELAFVEPSFTVACAGSGESLTIAYHPRGDAPPAERDHDVADHVRRRFGIGSCRVVTVDKDAVAKTGIGKIKRAQLVRDLAGASG